MPSLIDLHIHSNYSDGQFDVSKIIELSKRNNVHLISITDHDDIRSALEINNSSFSDIEFINGVELSSFVNLNGKDVKLHILGYGYDESNDYLNSRLDEKLNLRMRVNKKYLTDLINSFSYLNNDILEKVQCDRYIRLSRLIEKYLSDSNLSSKQINDILDYLRNVKIIYDGYDFDALESLKMIENADGYSVLAHPYQYRLTIQEEIDLLRLLKENGLVGLERYHSGDTREGMLLQEGMCDLFDLEWTVGSDFHTDYDDFGNEIGFGKNNNLCATSCSLVKKLRKNGKVLKK